MFALPTRQTLILGAAFAAFSSAAVAQDACSGGQWIGGGESASDISTAEDYREQMALVLSGNSYLSLFSLSAPTSVRVEAAGRGNGDPLIDLMDSDGNVILSDDDSGGNGAARIEIDLDPGTYCMALNSYEGAPMTAFVRIGRIEQEALTGGFADVMPQDGDVTAEDVIGDLMDDTDMPVAEGSCAEASQMGVLDGSLTASASVAMTPFWGFTLNADTAVSITAENEAADPIITLYDGDQTYLTENDDFDGLNSRIDYSAGLPAGDYCIGVSALNDPTLPIDITISVYDPVAALQGLYDRGEAAPPLDGSYPVTMLGPLSSRLRQDANVTATTAWYAVDIEQAGLMLVEAIAAGGNGDPWLVVYDDLGRQIGLNDDNGGEYDSLVTVRVTPGTYIVGVKQVSADTQGFIRMVFERYIPAP